MNQPAAGTLLRRSVTLATAAGGQIEVLIDEALGPVGGPSKTNASGETPPECADEGAVEWARATAQQVTEKATQKATQKATAQAARGVACDAAALAAAAPAIVLLPSSQRDAHDLGPLAAFLADAGLRVLRPQPRGMGGSSAPLDGLTLHHLAGDVAQVIASLGGGRAIVAGHAFGHFIARVADLDHAARVRGVVLLAAAARSFPPGLTQALDIAADAAQPRLARLAALQHAFFAPGNDPSPWLDGWHPQLREVYRLASATPPKQVWWPRSRAPILDLQAACDPWRPQASRNELRAALGAQVSVALIARASHALPHEQPAAVANTIIAWARTLPA